MIYNFVIAFFFQITSQKSEQYKSRKEFIPLCQTNVGKIRKIDKKNQIGKPTSRDVGLPIFWFSGLMLQKVAANGVSSQVTWNGTFLQILKCSRELSKMSKQVCK